MADVGDAAANGGRKLFTRCCQSVSPYIFYLVGIVGIVFIALFTALLLMFLIHQLTIWMSQDPVRAFHAAQHTVQIFAAGWGVARGLQCNPRNRHSHPPGSTMASQCMLCSPRCLL